MKVLAYKDTSKDRGSAGGRRVTVGQNETPAAASWATAALILSVAKVAGPQRAAGAAPR